MVRLPIKNGIPQFQQASPRGLAKCWSPPLIGGWGPSQLPEPVHFSKGQGMLQSMNNCTLDGIHHYSHLQTNTVFIMIRLSSQEGTASFRSPLICWRVTNPSTNPQTIPFPISFPTRAQFSSLRSGKRRYFSHHFL